MKGFVPDLGRGAGEEGLVVGGDPGAAPEVTVAGTLPAAPGVHLTKDDLATKESALVDLGVVPAGVATNAKRGKKTADQPRRIPRAI